MLAFDSGASQEVDESVSELDSCDASFVTAGDESALEEARQFIKKGHMRAYQAFGDMGYKSAGDAASKEPTYREATATRSPGRGSPSRPASGPTKSCTSEEWSSTSTHGSCHFPSD